MYFSLHSNHSGQSNTDTFFCLHTGEWRVYSPVYPDRKVAVQEMENLVMRLRRAAISKLYRTTDDPLVLELTFFGGNPGIVPSPVALGELDDANDRLTRIKASASGNTYRIIAYEVVPGEEDLPLTDYPSDYITSAVAWQEVGSSLLHLSQNNRSKGFRANIGGQLNPSLGPCEQIFNALQPFVSTDISLFRGRKRETEEIHTLLKGNSMLLLYGPSRVGKTSLLQCGLANRLKEDDADLLMVSCSEGAVFDSLDTVLQVQLAKLNQTNAPNATGPLALARQLAAATERRQYLVFDQIEDILTAEFFDADRAALLGFIKELIDAEPDRFRVILSLREEYLAPLAEQEEHLPNLLAHRFRLIHLRENSMANATVNFLDFLKANGSISVDDSQAVAERVCRDLADEKGNVSAHCLQIYLHQVHQKSCQETEQGPVPINTELLDRFGPPRVLIDEYYTTQVDQLEALRLEDDEVSNILVGNRIEELQSGRRDCGCEEKNSKQKASTVVAAGGGFGLGWLAALLLFPLGALLAWFVLPPGQADLPSSCELLEQDPGNCTAYVNYLCANDQDTTCIPSWLTTTDLNDCEVWRDYKGLIRRESCISYQAFYKKYRDQGVCMDFVQPRLLSWECPLVVDTVKLTVRDTVIRRVPASPTTYGGLVDPTPEPATTPDCQTLGSIILKSVGPLLVATDPLPGGPYRWEDALSACNSQGLRLPCIGEIDFLIEKIYRDDPNRAYEMLSGAGACNLINPAEVPEGRIEFWTATEANDATAWSFYFDTGLKTIGRQSNTPKSARMPCLCVKKDPTQRGSSLPACYGKQIDRRSE